MDKYDMEESVKKMIRDLRARAVSEVPDEGEFKIVYEEFPNTDKGLDITDIMLKITKPPKDIEGHERKRYLELVLYNLPSPYICESIVGRGSKADIIAKLSDDNLPQFLIEKIIKMERDLSDTAWEMERNRY